MDSSDLEKEMKADNSSLITPSKRDIFLSTYRRQNFYLPNSMMHYIAKNPKNSKVYLKTIKRCKYFFIKNSILVISHLSYNQNGWKIYVNETWKNIDINTISAKVWITDYFFVYPGNVSNNSVASSVIPKIYQCDIKTIDISYQVISFHEIIFLCSSVKVLDLDRVTVKNDDGTVLAFENIIEQLPNVKKISYAFANPSNNTSKNTFKELWKISHLSNYSYFGLANIPEDFDIESFHSYMKKNQNTLVCLSFSDQISEEYKARLEGIVDEIIETKNHEYNPPYICFPGIDFVKLYKIYDILKC